MGSNNRGGKVHNDYAIFKRVARWRKRRKIAEASRKRNRSKK